VKPKLIIFDFDGVLADTQDIINEIEWNYLLQHGMYMTLQVFSKRFTGATVLSIVEALKEEKNIELLENPQQFAKEVNEAILVKLVNQKIKPFQGVKDTLGSLPFKKCVASNCSLRILRTLLSACTLTAYFNGNVFSADMVSRPKPYPDLFLLAARSMGIEPDQCLVIEDSEIGVKAATAAGMKA
jgi:phosphoglycolate phosphatase